MIDFTFLIISEAIERLFKGVIHLLIRSMALLKKLLIR